MAEEELEDGSVGAGAGEQEMKLCEDGDGEPQGRLSYRQKVSHYGRMM